MADLDLTQLPPSGFQSLTGIKAPNFASAVIQFLFVAAGVLFLLFTLVGAVQWITSGGDKEGLDHARRKIKNALIGLVIVLGIYALGGVLNATLGVDLFSVCLPGPDTPASFKCPSSGVGSGGSGGSPGTSACPCYNGGCASTGTVAPLTLGGACYRCTASGWSSTGTSGCPSITCGSCN